MARRRRGDDERSMDSLMDALTNVVGILLLILIVSSLGISAAVRQVVENLPQVTQEELEAMKVSREKTLKNLQDLKQTHTNTLDSLPTKEEAAALAAELEEFEKDNAELAKTTSDIEEWKAKVEKEAEKKEKNEEKVTVADKRNRELAAILADTPEIKVNEAKVVAMPDPRFADEEFRAFYIVCRNEKLYYIGDPYEHGFKIRDVIDQNFSDLAYTGNAIGSYTYSLKSLRKNDRDQYIALSEEVRFTKREQENLGAWNTLKTKWANREGVIYNQDKSIVERLIGADDKANLVVSKFRYDAQKITNFFGDGKLGPRDFKYFVTRGNGDRMKMTIGFKEEGGWTPDQFLAQNSEFEQACKKASMARRVFFYYFVAPDSFDTYLQARAKSEQFRVPAGWTIWQGEKFEPKAVPQMVSTRYNLNLLAREDYMKLAKVAGPAMIKELNAELTQLDARVQASVPKDLPAAKRQEFITNLKIQRAAWNASRFQPYVMNIFQTPLAAQEVIGNKEIVVEIHPPEIPGIRVFVPSRPPTKPVEPKKPAPPNTNPPKPKPKPTLILD